MAAQLDDGEFWLPPQFLTEDDILMDFRADQKTRVAGSVVYFPSLGSSSGFSSPVESVTETESDEEDYIAWLTRKIAHSTLEDDFEGYENPTSWPISGSPQSTLCGVTGGWGGKQGLSRGRPKCPSMVSCPTASAAQALESRKDPAWGLLNAAAGEVARVRIIEEKAGHVASKGVFPSHFPPKNHNPNLRLHANQSPSCQQLQVAAQFQLLRHEQMMRQNQSQPMVQNRARNARHPLDLLPPAWPTLQQSQQQQQEKPQNNRPGSGMRAVFLGKTASKRECPGTGVFLPRRIGSPTENPRKNKGCSMVLIPDRVVQSLNWNLDAVDAQSQPLQSRCKEDAPLRERNGLMGYPQRGRQSQPVMNQELRLPSEWTY